MARRRAESPSQTGRSIVLGLPYLTSLISHHAGLIALDADRTEVLFQDVGEALDRALGEIELRLPPGARHQIGRAGDNGRLRELGEIARVALQHSGRLPQQAVREAVQSPLAAHEYLRSIATESGFIALLPDDPDGAYTFVDDGMAQYLWLRLVRDNALPSRAR